ncbi:hypothetical protein ACTXT7_003318 [Hymenolepis weldensis]
MFSFKVTDIPYGIHSFYLQRLGAVDNRDLFTPSRGPPIDGSQCPQCGSSLAVAGPLWADELHNHEFIQGLLESMKQLKKTGKMDDSSIFQGHIENVTFIRIAELQLPEGKLNKKTNAAELIISEIVTCLDEKQTRGNSKYV